MRYEVIWEKFDEDGRFTGRVEIFSDDMSWRSGPSDVILEATTKNSIERALRDYAEAHDYLVPSGTPKKVKPPKVTLTKGIIDSKTGDVALPAKVRDKEGKEVVEAVGGAVAEAPVG